MGRLHLVKPRITVAAAPGAGFALRLGENILEVPISAMLILSADSRPVAVGRVVETRIGTATGLIAGFVLTSPQVQSAGEAIEDLYGKLGFCQTGWPPGSATNPP